MGDDTQISDRGEAVKALADKTGDVRFAMLTTVGTDGVPRCRPMATHEVGDDGTLWFFTYAASKKVRDVQAGSRVSLGYADPGKNLWVSVAGTGEVVRDDATKKRLWSAPLKVFFPDGPEDPEVVLLKVTPAEGEIWDGPSTTIGRAVAFAKTYATSAQEPPGDDVRLDFTR